MAQSVVIGLALGLVVAASPFPLPLLSSASGPIPACASFAQAVLADQDTANVVFINATAHGPGTYNVSNTFNTYGFCEVNAAVKYTANDSLRFALWLPDIASYGGSFTAVGR
jgi:hypothetical protein